MKDDKKLSSLSRDVLAMIKDKKIKPASKWKFILHDYFVWAMSIFSIFVGSLAFSVIIYMLKNSDWDIYENINDSLFEFILVTLPYFWIVFLIIFVFVADYNLKHTKRGYKYRVHFLTLVSVGVSMCLGLLLYNVGVGRAIDNAFAERVPLYSKNINKMHQRGMMWHRPQDGFLAGVVIEIQDDNNFIIHDIHDTVWYVDGSTAEVLFQGALAVKNGVRIYGEDVSALSDVEGYFRAIKVLPLPSRSWLQQNDIIKHDVQDRLLSPEAKARLREDTKKTAPRQAEKDEIGKSCSKNEDCKTPFSFLIKSDCPYESRCLASHCSVVCPMFYDDYHQEAVQCEENSDCDCSEFLRGRDAKCLCHEQRCLTIVAD